MSTSTIVAFRDALATAIGSQLTSDGTTGVTINKYPVVDTSRVDVIFLKDAEATQEHLALGGSREELYTLSGEVVAPQSGGSLDEASEAETRAILIFASIEDTLRADPTVTATVFNAEIASYKSAVVIDENGYIGHIEFTIDVTGHI